MIFREAENGDLALILDATTRTLRASPYFHGHPFGFVRATVERLLASPKWTTTIAVDPDAPEEILGFVVSQDPQTIAYVHVKALYRSHGVARALISHLGTQAGEVRTPFLLPAVAERAKRNGLVVRFRPYLVLDI